MIVDGKQIADRIYGELKTTILESGLEPTLSIITCAPNFETKKYLALKEKKAAAIGIAVSIIELMEDVTTDACITAVEEAVLTSSGIIVQLPLPSHIDTKSVLAAVPPSHDVDVLNPKTVGLLSPVVGACKEILDTHDVSLQGKLVTVLGAGKLVGQPAAAWCMSEGASVSIVTRDTVDIPHYTKSADIVVCGAGDAGFLKPSMVKEGVIILDAGASEEGGILKGDADPLCAEIAALFTPVPGGIGPVTVAVLLRNLVECTKKWQHAG